MEWQGGETGALGEDSATGRRWPTEPKGGAAVVGASAGSEREPGQGAEGGKPGSDGTEDGGRARTDWRWRYCSVGN